MANQNAPFGFRYVGLIDGSPPNFGIYTGKIASTNTNSIFTGDVLKPIASGYYDVQSVTSGGEAIGGIAIGFSWNSKSVGYKVWRPYYPGSDANGDVEVKVVTHPQAVFEVQCTLGPILQASVGLQANFNVGSGGNTYSGISSFSLDDSTLATSANLPFTVFDLTGSSTIPLPTAQGSAYNVVKVIYNRLTQV